MVVATLTLGLYRLHHPEATLTLVLTLLIHDCPSADVVAAFGLDERTVRVWLHKAGAHAALLHDQMTGGVEARHVQADEIRVRVRGSVVWAALVLDVGSRLWLATAVARRRDGLPVHLLLRRTLASVAGRAFLLAVAGFASYDELLRMPAHPVPLMVPVRLDADDHPRADALSRSHDRPQRRRRGQPHDHGCVQLYGRYTPAY